MKNHYVYATSKYISIAILVVVTQVFGIVSAKETSDDTASAVEVSPNATTETAAGTKSIVGGGTAGEVVLAHTAAVDPAPAGDDAADGTVSADAAAANEIGYDTQPFNGEFTTTIEIDIPKYQDLAPSIALEYESNNRNGQIGLGWQLAGFSTIMRLSPGRGAPRYNDTDIFLLDRNEIIPCSAEMNSPGCQYGGTHTAKVENYQRLTLDSESNRWTLTFKDGIRLIYGAQLGHDVTTPSGTFHWVLETIVDTHGNQVDYSYWCDETPAAASPNDCYAESVAYNGTHIKFYWEARPDIIFRATGNSLMRTAYRLKTVDIQVAGDRLATYALSYSQSAYSQKSLLTQVMTHGRDAVIDNEGAVAHPGTTLPPVDIQYAEEAGDTVTLATGAKWCKGAFATGGDFDGDGRIDYRCGTRVGLSKGDGSFEVVDDGKWCGGEQLSIGDFNGDGQTDFQCHRQRDGKNWIKMSRNGRHFDVIVGEKWCAGSNLFSLGDFNGDGKTDYQCKRARDGQNWVNFSNGDGTFTLVQGQEWCRSGTFSMRDFNGDGRTDYHCRDGGRNAIALSNGDGSFTRVGGFNFCFPQSDFQFAFGDFNGDGLTDYHCHNPEKGTTSIALSHGNGRFTKVSGPKFCKGYKLSLGDFNGDHFTDYQCHNKIDGYTAIAFSLGDGTFNRVAGARFCKEERFNTFAIDDFNGDGMKDYQCHNTDSGANTVRLSVPARHLKLARISNRFGGSTQVDYTPSSTWLNVNNPPIVQTVSRLSRDDGRGRADSVRVTTHSYGFGLEDKQDRLFMGFKTARKNLPCIAEEDQCPYEIAVYRQDRATRGNVESIRHFSGDAQLLRSQHYYYDVDHTVLPLKGLLTGRTLTEFVNGESKQSGIDRAFDAFGNVVRTTSLGDLAVQGDERSIHTTFAPNTSDYIVELPAKVETFDGAGDLAQKVAEIRYLYDGAQHWTSPPSTGNRTQEQSWLDSENRFIATRMEYDTRGNVIDTYDPVGARTEFVYGATGEFVIETRNPLYFAGDTRHKTRATWDIACGVPLTETNENNQATRFQYDALCRKKRVDFPSGDFEAIEYKHHGDPKTQYTQMFTSGPQGQSDLWHREFFDGFERTYRSEKPAGDGAVLQSLTEFNLRGSAAAQSDWHRAGATARWTAYHYDNLDRKTRLTEADGRVMRWDYQLGPYFDRVVRTNHQGKRSVKHYDAYDNMVQQDRFLGGKVVSWRADFDALNRVTGITDDAGNHWIYHFDSLGRQVQVDDPDLGIRQYAYDDVGRLLVGTDALGQRTEYEYDLHGRKRRETALAGTPSPQITEFSYDEASPGHHNVGLLTTAGNDHAVIRYDYDKGGRQVQSVHDVDGQTYRFNTAFDAAGRILWQRYPDGDGVGSDAQPWQYDAAGQLQTIPGLIEDIVYNDHGLITRKVLGNGVITDYGYNDDNDWLMSIVSQSGAETIQNIVHQRDSLGLITQISSSFAGESWRYGYDDLYRLKAATNLDDTGLSQSFDYDTVGNMVYNSKVGDYRYGAPGGDRPHAVLAAGPHTYEYDLNGNMISGSGRQIDYDGSDRPIRINTGTFAYGPDGRRVKKVENGVTTLYIENLEIREGEVTKYLPEDAKRYHGENFWLHKDHLQSVQAVTNSAGEVVQRYAYAAYGERLRSSSDHIETHGFVGERLDETGLLFLNARYYDPLLSRFISADPSDPLEAGVGLNRYSYAFNNPIYLKDPSGLTAEGGEGDRGRGLSADPGDESDNEADENDNESGNSDEGILSSQQDYLDAIETMKGIHKSNLLEAEEHNRRGVKALEEAGRLRSEGKVEEAEKAEEEAEQAFQERDQSLNQASRSQETLDVLGKAFEGKFGGVDL
ncbi:hypothetical protein FKG94_16255 [Exilibacterium tricleocarpae]|uniref:Uncharacterized protein n=1 Tax=Exilibacterium tricleocarpae TaxID=2591008 RepID=A0A545TAC2_9GAMM|nr:FG-GAP-like repeat-containing protein [Exilibacterium tricleocarpae]TQV74161.1 hypothetical protein FKG94_16255 [Exilibacterium tricleocarpae]